MKIAIMGDVHGAAAPYHAALTAARNEGFDQLLIIGDLLTYGTDPVECLELTRSAIAQDDAILVAGNHDQLYLDMDNGKSAYFDSLPDWIKESVSWTREAIGRGFSDEFKLQEEWDYASLLVAHANPFGYGDWTYLRSDVDRQRAALTLAKRGYRHGVFAHTHRASRFISDDAIDVYTIGSLGQPRDLQEPRPQWAMVETTDNHFNVGLRYIDQDWRSHRDGILSTSMSDATKSKLCGFYSQ